MSYRADIDGLRAVAVLLVLVFHFKFVPGGSGGFLGVDVFFVISGFLITSIVRTQIDSGTFSLVDFLLRRVKRLAPSLVVVLFASLCWGYLRLLPDDFMQLAREALATQLYVANILFWRTINYFGLQADSVYLLHTWSLAVEEQFYLLYPLALLLVLRVWHQTTKVVAIVALVALTSFALNIFFVDSKPEATFYLMPTRAWELVAGGLLTWLPATRQDFVPSTLSLVGAALIAISATIFDPGISFPGWFALLPVLGAACLIYAGPQARFNRALAIGPLVYVGRISYTLYLVHWPLNVFASYELGQRYTLEWRVAMFVLCFAISAAIYHSIEHPMRLWRARRKVVAASYLVALALGVIASLLIITLKGVPYRLPEDVVSIAAHANDRAGIECRYSDNPETLCVIGAQNAEPRWLIFGDSHAWAAQAAFDHWLTRSGQAAVFTFLNSCPPILGVDVVGMQSACRRLNESMFSIAKQNASIERVFLVSTWRQAVEGHLTDETGRWLGPSESTGLFRRQLHETLVELNELGKQVYVWAPVPGARENVPRELALASWRGRSVDLNHTLQEHEERIRFFSEPLASSRELIHGLFSPADALCNRGGECVTQIDGVPVYFDNSHLSLSLSLFWADALEEQIGSASQ